MRKRLFGRDEAGRPVEEVILESADAAVSILALGCITRDWRVDGPRGTLPMVLGFPRLEDYLHHSRSHGAVVGRVANRTGGASFTLDGRTHALTANDGANHLHGGAVGLAGRIWDMETDTPANTLYLFYRSPDGEEGYPGNVDFAVSFRLEGPRLICEMTGTPDRPTPISLANHNYYNLGGEGTVKDHLLWIAAREYTPTDAALVPTGEIRPLDGTGRDFSTEREIGDTALDLNLVLDPARDRKRPTARARCPRTGRQLELWTDEPGMQLFDAPEMTIAVPGHDGQSYGPFAGLCLEAQHFPDSLHQPDWPSIVATPEKPYFQRLVVEIGRA
ncbi:aldose epimerase family protein [Amaricoccus sp.]|uniref:aldose epimerase family protein n=1 Tax=Amaricoccus sp. TaxID=1872485 RepID=UPI00260BEA3C|nr:aldose epimerase family protein [Amaricoccus sp.]HRO10916.1 aldose epimerase family protein [Amaricoccus sp.]